MILVISSLSFVPLVTSVLPSSKMHCSSRSAKTESLSLSEVSSESSLGFFLLGLGSELSTLIENRFSDSCKTCVTIQVRSAYFSSTSQTKVAFLMVYFPFCVVINLIYVTRPSIIKHVTNMLDTY